MLLLPLLFLSPSCGAGGQGPGGHDPGSGAGHYHVGHKGGLVRPHHRARSKRQSKGRARDVKEPPFRVRVGVRGSNQGLQARVS